MGKLSSTGAKIGFAFYPAFLKLGLDLSPLHLPLRTGVQLVQTQVFDGLFGVFADSLPDGWGRLLVDRSLRERGVSPSVITPLYRLACVGELGPGALVYRPVETWISPLDKLPSLDHLAEDSKRLLSGDTVEDLDALAQVGGSSGGARPKALVGYHPKTGQLLPHQAVLPKGYEPWIIKFSASTDGPEFGAVEYAYALMAQAAGITVSDSRLFVGQSGAKYFGTKRFDRSGNDRLHLHSAAGLLHDNFRLSAIDYGHLMDAAIEISGYRNAALDVLRMAAFNVYAHNRDDHSRNLSFLMDAEGTWRLAPAYDLTFSQSAHGEHSITVAGVGRNPGQTELLALADAFALRNAIRMIDDVRAAVGNWPAFAKTAGVSAGDAAGLNKVLRSIGAK